MVRGKMKAATGILLILFLLAVLSIAPLKADQRSGTITDNSPSNLLGFEKISSGKIAYDTFSASGGTAPDIPWTVVYPPTVGTPTVEDGKLKMMGPITVYPTDVSVTDFVWEAKVKPMVLKDEGPEMVIFAQIGEEQPPRASFDYYNTARLLRIMIGPTVNVLTTYQTRSFVMSTEIWYAMKVVVSVSNMKCYLDNVLIFNVNDSNVTPAPSQLWHGGFTSGEWGYWDDIKIWKSNTITITNLQHGQKVELYDGSNNLKASDVIGVGETKATLDVSVLTFPFEGYFKIYANDGITLLHTTPLYNDIWGGDEYTVHLIYDELLNAYNKLKSDYDSLKSSYDELQANYTSLKSNYDSLRSDHDKLRTDYNLLGTSHESLKTNYESLKAKYADLESKYQVMQVVTSELTYVKNLIYVFIATTIAFMATTIYFASRKPK